MSRSMNLLRNTPPATFGIIALCATIFLLQNIFSIDLQLFTMCPRLVIYTHEFYRIVSSTLFHANMIHIGMNMLSTSAISSLLEKQLGTIRFLCSVLWAVLCSGIVYITFAWTAYQIFGYDNIMYEHAIGFSGIIFHMSVLECNFHPNASRNIFGFFSVPSFLYPWALLVVLQMIIPNLSFMGHLSGIITGTLQAWGIFECILPGECYCREMETWGSLHWLVNIPSFAATPTTPTRFQQTGGLVQATKRGAKIVIKFVKDCLETLYVCIFGRGHSINSNIRFMGRDTLNNHESPGQVSCPVDVLEEASEEEKEPLSRLV